MPRSEEPPSEAFEPHRSGLRDQDSPLPRVSPSHSANFHGRSGDRAREASTASNLSQATTVIGDIGDADHPVWIPDSSSEASSEVQRPSGTVENPIEISDDEDDGSPPLHPRAARLGTQQNPIELVDSDSEWADPTASPASPLRRLGSDDRRSIRSRGSSEMSHRSPDGTPAGSSRSSQARHSEAEHSEHEPGSSASPSPNPGNNRKRGRSDSPEDPEGQPSAKRPRLDRRRSRDSYGID